MSATTKSGQIYDEAALQLDAILAIDEYFANYGISQERLKLAAR